MSEPSFQSVPSAPLTGATRARPSRWEAAFAAHYVALCEYVLRFVGSAEAAEDVVQDLFLHLWDTRGPRCSSGPSSPRSYSEGTHGLSSLSAYVHGVRPPPIRRG